MFNMLASFIEESSRMDETIEHMDQGLGFSIERKNKRFSNAARSVKWGLVVGSAITTMMHFFVETWEGAFYVGIFSAFLVMLAAVFLIYIDEDSIAEMEIARKTITVAKEFERKCAELVADYNVFSRSQTRRNQLYVSMKIMRDAIECLIGVDGSNPEIAARLILKQGARNLRLACGFAAEDHHTMTIYKARSCGRRSPHSKELYPVATDRSIECPLELARAFPAGMGATGIAYSNNTEVFNEDASKASAVDLPPDLKKDTDVSVHASMVAVPIRLRGQVSPWGVVTLSSSARGHFDRAEQGLQTAEPARAIAAMMALAAMVFSAASAS